MFPISRFGDASPLSASGEWSLLLAGWWVGLAAWALLFAALLRRIVGVSRGRSLYLAACCHLPLLLCLGLVAAVHGSSESSRVYAFTSLGRQLLQPLARDFVILAPLSAQTLVLAVHRWRTLAGWLPVMAILLASLGLRLSHAAWGLPGLLHPDEARYFGPATMMVARGDPNPHYFENPSVMIYVAALLFWLLTEHSIAFHVMDEFYNLGIPDPRGDFLQMVALRGVSAAAGTLTVLATYLAAREVAGRGVGLFAASLLALSLLHIRNSHYATNDILATCFLAFSLLFAVRIYTRRPGGEPPPSGMKSDIEARNHEDTKPRSRMKDLRVLGVLRVFVVRSPAFFIGDYLLAGLFGGLATSTKYNAGIFAVAIVVAHLASVLAGRTGASGARDGATGRQDELHPRRHLPLLLGGLAALAAFLVGTPFALLDYPRFVADFRSQFGYGSEIWRGQEAGNSALAFLAALAQGFGAVPLALAALGVLVGVRRDRWAVAVLLSTPLVYFLFMSSLRLFFARFAIPVLPYLAVMAGYGIDQLARAARVRFASGMETARRGEAPAEQLSHTRSRPAVASRPLPHAWLPALLLAVALAQPLAFSLRHDLLLGRADTRLQAAAWIDANVPRDASLAMENYAHPDGKFGWKGHEVSNTRVFWPEREDQLAEAIGGAYRYVVVSSFGYGPLQRKGDSPSVLPPAYEPLERRGRLVARFDPDAGASELPYSLDDMYTPFWRLFDRERPGPTVRIYQMD